MTAVLTYTRYELLRTFRNKRFFIFSLGFPIVFYLLLAGTDRNNHNFGGDATHHTGLFGPQYYMVGMLAFGAMAAALAGGARIAAERSIGWNRQLRLTPLTPRSYFRAKIVTGYAMVLCSMALLYAAGSFYGVRLPARRWLRMTALILVGLIPFAALGIALGHLLTPDSMGPALGGGVGAVRAPGRRVGPDHRQRPVRRLLPAASVVLAGAGRPRRARRQRRPWGLKGWLVIGAWSVACSAFAIWAYRRDTQRV